MNRAYLIGPLLLFAVFGGYYVYWKTHPSAKPSAAARAVDPYVTRDGKQEAEAELAAGKLALIESGPGVSWDRERRELALTKYGVELRHVDEVSGEAMARYIDAFNRVMRPRIVARHGRGFFDTLHEQAIALMESRRVQ